MRYVFFIFLLFLLVNCDSETSTNKELNNSSTDSNFTLHGTVTNSTQDYMLLFKQNDIEKKESTLVDTIQLDKAGNFIVQLEETPNYYTLEVNKKVSVPLILDTNQNVQIKVDKNDFKVTGSRDTDLYLAYEKFRANSLERLVKSIRKAIASEKSKSNPDQEKIDSLGELEISNYDLHLTELNTYLKEKVGASLALYPTSIRWKGETNLELYDSLVTEVENKYSGLEITKQLREKVNRLEQTSIGGTAANIEMKTIDGNKVSLFDQHKEYTLIEFWASWCGPCRRESETLNSLYEKYKDQGFNIYAISLDSNEKLWKNASKIDEREYTNVSSLEGFKTPAAYAYAVTALPMNYIVDSNGEIIAKDIHGEELVAFVEKIMAQ